jgi:hypothetical protein
MSKDPRIQLALDNWDEYVNTLTKLSDKELVKKLYLIDIQAQIAFKNANETSAQLLELWWKQTVEARILKTENNILDAPNEIEIAIAKNKREAKQYAERNKIIESKPTMTEHEVEDIQSSSKVHKATVKEEDDNQMSLF